MAPAVKKKLSRLRSVPDELHMPDGNGGKVKLLGQGVLECVCGDCQVVYWVNSNIGELSCPGCRGSNVTKTWTTARIAFIPQYE